MDEETPQQQRELVFCHRCENEWYREEHGLICPACQSDFTEIIESSNDPRQEEGPPSTGGSHGLFAPDPDEEDISGIRWTHDPANPSHARGTFTRDINIGSGGAPGEAGIGSGGAGGLLGLLGPAIQGILGAQRQQPAEVHQNMEDDIDHNSPDAPNVRHEQLHGGYGGTLVRHGAGPGYSFTITTSNNNLLPRDANGPQPFQNQPDHLNRMMAQMIANIGVMPGHGLSGRGHIYEGHMHGGHIHGGDPMFMEIGGGHNGGQDPRMAPFANIFQLLGVPQGGVHGDAVYSQEGLDRIISQLMEQHRSGNAPPPASAEAIDSLPQRPISQKDVGDSNKADCSICMDEAELGSMVTELPCGHWFHHDCIKAWLGEHDTCPHCRQGITPKEDAGQAGRARQPRQEALHDVHRDQLAGDTEGTAGSVRQSGGGLFDRLRQTFSPSASSQQRHQNQNQQDGSR